MAEIQKDETVPEFEFIEEALFDGTHDKLHDDNLLKCHEAGKPKKLAIKWHKKRQSTLLTFGLKMKNTRGIR